MDNRASQQGNQQFANYDNQSENEQLLNGAGWLAFGNIFSRILGALYIIPWTILIGVNATAANGLFNMGYTIYAMFLLFATAGLPTAISKLIARYNARSAHGTSLILFNRGVRISLYTGVVAAIIMAALTPTLAVGRTELMVVLWSLVPAILILPLVAVFRGFFQGNSMMKISAMSQILEQVARILFILIATFIVLQGDSENWQGAVVASTFAAFIGALVAFIYLFINFLRIRTDVIATAKRAFNNNERLPKKGFVLGLFKQALPFILVGSLVTVYQLIDQYTYFPIMGHFWDLTDNSLLISFARFNANANKIIMIIVPLAMAIAGSALPVVTRAIESQNINAVKTQIYNVFRLFFVVMLVAGLGLYGVAMPIYVVFYGNSDPSLLAGSHILQVSTIFAIFYGFYSVAAMLVQSVNRSDEALRSLLYGAIIKLVFQVPMIYIFKDFGPLFSSIVGIIFASLYLVRVLYNNFRIRLSDMAQPITRITVVAIITGLVALGTTTIINKYLPLTRGYQLITLIAGVLIAGIVGFILLMQLHVADDLLDRYFGRLLGRGSRNKRQRRFR